MHPIEWLRAVARSGDVPQAELAGEAAAALSALGDDPQGLLMGCRRLLDRHPQAGALWWTCARLVSSADPAAEAQAVQSDLAADQVGLSLTLDLPDEARVALVGWSSLADEMAARRGDLRLLAIAAGRDEDDDLPGPYGRSARDRYGRRGSRSRSRAARRRGLADLDGRPGSATGHGLDDGDGLGGPGRGDPDGGGSDDDERITVVPPEELGAAVVESDVVLLEARAAGGDWFLVAPGALAAAAVARHRGTEVWMAVGVGRRLPASLFAVVQRRVLGVPPDATDQPGRPGRGPGAVASGDAAPGSRPAAGAARTAALGAGADLVERALVDRVVEPIEIGCPAPPELLRVA